MPTIKTKKEMNLGELLCWAIDNKEQAKFRDFRSESMRVRFNDSAKPEIIFDKQFLPIDQTFKVEIEEPVTEDTVISKMLTIYSDNISHIQENKSLQFLSKAYLKSAYILNDDLTMTLIWTREKGLIE